MNYSDNYYRLSQRFPEVPRLTPAHYEAMAMFNELAKCAAAHMHAVWTVLRRWHSSTASLHVHVQSLAVRAECSQARFHFAILLSGALLRVHRSRCDDMKGSKCNEELA